MFWAFKNNICPFLRTFWVTKLKLFSGKAWQIYLHKTSNMLTLRVFDNGHFRKDFYFFLFRNSLSVPSTGFSGKGKRSFKNCLKQEFVSSKYWYHLGQFFDPIPKAKSKKIHPVKSLTFFWKKKSYILEWLLIKP